MPKEIRLTTVQICAYCETVLPPPQLAIMEGYEGERFFCDEFCLSDWRLEKKKKFCPKELKSLDKMLSDFGNQIN